MAQPTFVPVTSACEVRPVMSTATPEIGRAPKKGLVRTPHPIAGRGRGTPAPDAGYALSIAQREVAPLAFAHEHDRHDVELGVALVAAKRAGAIGRAPTLGDVRAVLAHFDLGGAGLVDHSRVAPFVGLSHSYAAQRALADSVDVADLTSDGAA